MFTQESVPINLKHLVLRTLNKKKQYEIELRQFALTLHFYSARAYKYVRKSLNNILPHPDTMRRWCCSTNFQPGFSTEVLQHCKTIQRAQGEPILCSLMMDEMSIRQQVEYRNDRWYGFVHSNFDQSQDNVDIDYSNAPTASKALVFLLVATDRKWKVPMGYFLLDSSTGTERANLVRQAILLTAEHGVVVHSLTFDGEITNFSTAEVLGASFDVMNEENFRPYFLHPISLDKIFCYPDPSHMLKNARNAFGETYRWVKGNVIHEPFYDSAGKAITWKYLYLLNNYQKDLGVTFGKNNVGLVIEFLHFATLLFVLIESFFLCCFFPR